MKVKIFKTGMCQTVDFRDDYYHIKFEETDP